MKKDDKNHLFLCQNLSMKKVITLLIILLVFLLWSTQNVLGNTSFEIKRDLISLNLTYKNDFINQINKYREEKWLHPLRENKLLNYTAYRYAQKMYNTSHFEHLDLDGLNSWDRVLKTGYDYMLVLENLWKWYYSVDWVLIWLKNSPWHNKNLLDPRVSEIGVWFYKWYWVQLGALPFPPPPSEKQEPLDTSILEKYYPWFSYKTFDPNHK